jgi:hypothetical protein
MSLDYNRSPKSDPQRARVYKMENMCGTSGRALLGRKQLREALTAWSEAFGVPEPKLVFRPIDHAGEQQDDVIRLSTRAVDGRNPVTLAHEFSHYLMGLYDPQGRLAFHGPEFVGVMMLVSHVGGIMPIAGSEWLAERMKVKYMDVKDVRSPVGLARKIKQRVEANGTVG